MLIILKFILFLGAFKIERDVRQFFNFHSIIWLLWKFFSMNAYIELNKILKYRWPKIINFTFNFVIILILSKIEKKH